jgi:pilus assembly protein Flp/PilA
VIGHDTRDGSKTIVLEGNMLARLSKRFRDDAGATAVEYGLMVALIAAAIVTTVAALGTGLNGLFTTVTGSL